MSVPKVKIGDKDLKRPQITLGAEVGQKLKENLDLVTPEEKQLSGNEAHDYDVLSKATSVASNLQNIKERKRYALYIFLMVATWLVAILAIIIFVGLNKLKISDPVLMALIGATTLNVMTFFVIVTKYLFPSNNP